MRTTVTLDERLVSQVMRASLEKTKTRAVSTALAEYLRRKKIDKLRSMLGRMDMDAGALRSLRESEIKESEDLHG